MILLSAEALMGCGLSGHLKKLCYNKGEWMKIMTPLTPKEIKTIRDALKHCNTNEVDDSALLLELHASFSRIYNELTNDNNKLQYLHELRNRFREEKSGT